MRKHFILLPLLISLLACTHQSPFEMAKQGPTMRQNYENHLAGDPAQQHKLRPVISRHLENDLNYPKVQERAYRRIPNPELAMFVYPHRVTRHGLIVPAYTIKFPLYEKVQYGRVGDMIYAK